MITVGSVPGKYALHTWAQSLSCTVNTIEWYVILKIALSANTRSFLAWDVFFCVQNHLTCTFELKGNLRLAAGCECSKTYGKRFLNVFPTHAVVTSALRKIWAKQMIVTTI